MLQQITQHYKFVYTHFNILEISCYSGDEVPLQIVWYAKIVSQCG